MNLFEALFGFTDIYQKAQEKRKARIERKNVLEKPYFGRAPQEEVKEQTVTEEKHDSSVEKGVCRAAEFVSTKTPSSREDLEVLDQDVKKLLEKTEALLEVYQDMRSSVEGQDESIKAVQNSIEEHCSLLEEKIHSENVKSYRNVQAALDEMDKTTAKEESLVLLVSSLKTQLKCVTWFSVITLLVLIAYILFSLGVF